MEDHTERPVFGERLVREGWESGEYIKIREYYCDTCGGFIGRFKFE